MAGVSWRWIAAASLWLGCAPRVWTTEGTEAASAIQRRYCEALVAPGCSPVARDLERCVYAGFFDDEASAANAGRAVIDEGRLAACLSNIGCFTVPNECFDAFVGLGTAGSACQSDGECADVLHCARPEGPGCGVCEADFAAGATCRREAECGSGTIRDRRAGPACVGASLLEPGRCGTRTVAEVGEGEACGEERSDDELTVRRCAPPLTCIEGTCAPVLARLAGQPCFVDDCAEGLACAGGVCTVAAGPGEPCDEATPCDPAAPIVCLAGRCEPNPDELGDACSFFCAGGLRCIEGVCDEPSPLGASCVGDADCAEGRCDTRGTCVASC